MTKNRLRAGITIVELIMASVVGLIIILTAAVVLAAGHRNFNDLYDRANNGLQSEAMNTMLTFGSIGRKSNKNDYRIYQVNGTSFVPAVPPQSQPVSEVSGQAVEFRYWDSLLKEEFMDESQGANRYALFYLDQGQLKVDYGPCPPGGVDESSWRNDSSQVNTIVLAENVESVQFSHTTKNAAGQGNGCVKMVLNLKDQEKNRQLTVKTATLMRNVWP